jgi:ATP-dependent Zn protease
MTFGYSPAMLEHILDEALIWALRRGDDRLDWEDLQQAKMTEEIGLGQKVSYTEAERRTIATHEAGHATVAWLVGRSRKLEVLSIIKRRDVLGLLAHSELEERFTKSHSEIISLIQIAMGGMVAEELFFGETSTGVAGDLQAATSAAAQMIGTFGMAGSLLSYEAVATPTGNLVAKVTSTDEGRAAVEQILKDSHEEVRALLSGNRHLVEVLRDPKLHRKAPSEKRVRTCLSLESDYAARSTTAATTLATATRQVRSRTTRLRLAALGASREAKVGG